MKTIYKSTEVSKQIKKELKAAFKDVKFSVRYQSYSGGNNIKIWWDFGCTESDVKKIVDKYQTASYNSMEDIKEYNPQLVVDKNGEISKLGGVDYIFTSRYCGDMFEKVLDDVRILLSNDDKICEYEIKKYVSRLLSITIFPKDFIYKNVERRNDSDYYNVNNPLHLKIVFDN